MNETLTLHGTSASQGISQGPAFLVGQESFEEKDFPTFLSVFHELDSLKKALALTQKRLETLKEKTALELGAEESAIFEAHLMILEDPEILEQTRHRIEKEKLSAATSYFQTTGEFISKMSEIDDDYLKARATDLKDVRDQVLCSLLNRPLNDLRALSQPVVIIARDLTPSQFASLNKEMILGVVTEIGGKNSHTAIMARIHDIPTLVGVQNLLTNIQSNHWVVVDSAHGRLFVNPSPQQRDEFKKQIQDLNETKAQLMKFKNETSQTQDGTRIWVEANIGHPEDTPLIEKYGCEGVGLFRTEFLFLGKQSPPSEEEQYLVYRKVLEACGSHGAVIRTLDVGGDKQIPYLHIGAEENPFLGLRAVRYCLKNPELFKVQLRACLRASIHGNLSIMFPMISRLEEVLECRSLLKQCQEELKTKKQSFSDQVQIGIMIEIPSAALICDQLASHVDFFSIGTNDLIQYVNAVDRMNENVSFLYEGFNPAVLRLLSFVIQTAHNQSVKVAVCGEMASDPLAIPFLLGMGLTHFSQNPSSVLKTKALLKNIDLKECQELWKKAQSYSSITQIKTIGEKFLKSFSPVI